MNVVRIAIAAAWMLAASLGAQPATANEAARAVVAEFQQGLLGVMKEAKALGVAGRAERLSPVVEKAFNLPVMIATVAAPFWRPATPDQREALVSAFRSMSVASAATLFDGYSGESFRTVAHRPGSGGTVLVDTQIVRPGRDPVTITYVAANVRDRWSIVDIIVGSGISELTVRRSEYQTLLQQGGVPRLVAALRQKAENLLAGKEKAQVEGGR
jgi:phospholipid transport system substrate-binding protein